MDLILKDKLINIFGLLKGQDFQPLGEGHINQTWLVKSPQGQVVLQRLNTYVFNRPKLLMDNLRKVSDHLTLKKEQGLYSLDVMSLLLTADGQNYWQDEEHGLWRAIKFVPDSLTLQAVANNQQAQVVAEGFGEFTMALSDLAADELKEVIPSFHCPSSRLQQLHEAEMGSSREQSAQTELAKVKGYEILVDEFLEFERAGLQKRVTHNDTKVNNVLLSQDASLAKCVIDLDTVMPGYLMYDFGDMVRALVSPEAEDSANLDNVHVRLDVYEALLKGYSKALKQTMTGLEKSSLLLGVKLLPFVLGMRFLADYLRGDTYFGANYPEHNLVRARNQFALLDSILENETQLTELSHKYLFN
ncbi:phosphotransferase enzyme family protein [Paraferrimonas sp. SM1919]|uniref:phosphotransferase enzyme family protein n=1 Tax=Paraferrimonas sp. SM1919 TaxID=2662263 RepID=UPI0013D5DD0D|nr:aminoglycoside phosphotransferase family protein [Paraferrimonas sp. SM1919]